MRDYEYRGLMATTWDELRADAPRWEDRAFYLDVIRRSGEPVLDVGCGTGRLLLEYLAAGIDIDGVDCSPEMLALCRQKATALGLHPHLYQQYMEELELPRSYRTILVPSSSFQLLTDPAQAREAMQRFRTHLQRGGMLAMPFTILWRDGDPLEGPWRVQEVRRSDGGLVRRRFRSRYDPASQLEHTEDIYEVVRDGVIVASESYHRSPAVRWYTQSEALTFYEGAGLADVQLCHKFSFAPARADDTLFCLLGTPALPGSHSEPIEMPGLSGRISG